MTYKHYIFRRSDSKAQLLGTDKKQPNPKNYILGESSGLYQKCYVRWRESLRPVADELKDVEGFYELAFNVWRDAGNNGGEDDFNLALSTGIDLPIDRVKIKNFQTPESQKAGVPIEIKKYAYLLPSEEVGEEQTQEELWYDLINDPDLFNLKFTVQETIEIMKQRFTLIKK